jgi:hypothetical protein
MELPHIPVMVRKPPRLPEHACPHCGTLYTVAVGTEESATDYHNAICTVCGDVMAEWHTKENRQYSRQKLSRDPNQLAKTIVGIAATRQVKDRPAKQGRTRLMRWCWAKGAGSNAGRLAPRRRPGKTSRHIILTTSSMEAFASWAFLELITTLGHLEK